MTRWLLACALLLPEPAMAQSRPAVEPERVFAVAVGNNRSLSQLRPGPTSYSTAVTPSS